MRDGGGDDLINQNDPLGGSIETVELAIPIGDLSTGETTLTRDPHSDDDVVITVTSGSAGAEVVDHSSSMISSATTWSISAAPSTRFASSATAAS